uniref:Putative conserved plasma membrane protein n=1 Tax=Nyssomyia neivai TaxID=330878 RepID=A0A1L8DA46_9DIPT
MYSSFKYLRPIVVFAGVIGMLQSLLWIAFAITALTAYYCHMTFENVASSVGTLFELTFFHVYFRGPCDLPDFPPLDLTIVDNLPLLEPIDVHAMAWAYLIISFFWLISSLTIVLTCKEEYVKYANIFLFIWIFLTLGTSVVDMALGILFGLDYGTIMEAAHNVPLAGATVNHAILLGAQASAGVLMGVAFRGFLLWLINIALALYIFTHTFKIADHNRMKSGIDNASFAHDPHSMKTDKPIDAYGFNSTRPVSTWQTPSTFHPERHHDDRDYRRPITTYELQPTQQPPPVTRRRDDDVILRRDAAASVAREINHRNSFRNEPGVPAPDYSPPMPRSNPYENRPALKSAMRSSRYQ